MIAVPFFPLLFLMIQRVMPLLHLFTQPAGNKGQSSNSMTKWQMKPGQVDNKAPLPQKQRNKDSFLCEINPLFDLFFFDRHRIRKYHVMHPCVVQSTKYRPESEEPLQ